MFRIFLIVVGVALVLGIGAVVGIGMFPTDPPRKAIEKTLPNDRFQSR